MEQVIKEDLPIGAFRIICKNCHHVFYEGVGGITEYAIAAMNQSDLCSYCGGVVVLEANPEISRNRYDEEHLYQSK